MTTAYVEEILSPDLRRERIRQDNCVHRWTILSPDGNPTLPGVCRNCGLVRTFVATLPDPTPKEIISSLRLHRRESSEHRAYEAAAYKLAQEGF